MNHSADSILRSGGTRPIQSTSPNGVNSAALISAAAMIVAGDIWIADAVSGRQAALFILGTLLGLVLYHASFGFTSAWRVFISDRRGSGLRAQMLMLAVATALFFPALASGSLFGQPVTGLVSPLGVSVIFGAFIFGIGMQMGGGCASGTLYTVGGGSTRMLITLAAFVVGSTVGAYHLSWWSSLPSFPPISLVKAWGPWLALAVHWTVFGCIVVGTLWLEKRAHGSLLARPAALRSGFPRFLRGPWPILAGAIGLALLNFATLALAGRPWGITSAFALWGSKIAGCLGLADVSNWTYWASAERRAELTGSVLNDVTSVMDVGIILGALLAAALAGRFSPKTTISARSAAAAVVGGLLLGYGARLAYGCNIGAYFSGIASGSLHGWAWMVAAFFGNVLGTRVRPFFGLEVERTVRQTGC
ncbi:MAG: hypothetical protein JWM36_2692 [Hyphomicrobiales bacterium]|nr:hypothetical protein [Hyphomicrobiales bacterium]